MRVPSPPKLSSTPRSGVVVMDWHDVHITQQGESSSSRRRTKRHENNSGRTGPLVLGKLQFGRLLVATAPPSGEPFRRLVDLY